MVKKIDYWESVDGKSFSTEKAAKKHEFELILKDLGGVAVEKLHQYATPIVQYLIDGGYVNCCNNKESVFLACRNCR